MTQLPQPCECRKTRFTGTGKISQCRKMDRNEYFNGKWRCQYHLRQVKPKTEKEG